MRGAQICQIVRGETGRPASITLSDPHSPCVFKRRAHLNWTNQYTSIRRCGAPSLGRVSPCGPGAGWTCLHSRIVKDSRAPAKSRAASTNFFFPCCTPGSSQGQLHQDLRRGTASHVHPLFPSVRGVVTSWWRRFCNITYLCTYVCL